MTETGLRIYDLIKGTHVRKTMRFLEKSRHWSLEELQNYQEEKLGRLLERVEAEVPFYQLPATGYRLPEDVTIERLSDVAILDREMVMDAGDTLLSGKINLKKCKIGRTGGTTGPPLRLYRDRETRSWALAAYYRFYSWMGIEPGMREVELWGSTDVRIEDRKSKIEDRASTQHQTPNTPNLPRTAYLAPRPGIFDRISNFRTFNAFSFNNAYLEEVVLRIQRFKPALIRGYLSAIILLADYIKRNNIKGIHPISVSCTSETLFPEYRKMIEEVFRAPLFDQYGCGECNSIAFECKEHNGLHITMEHCILESDDEHNLIVTNLDNYSQPFIRNKTGDKGIIDHTPCPCGNNSPRIVELHGRANENVILKDGSSVNGIFFANLLDQAGYINSNKMLRFQIVQDREGEIEFKAETGDRKRETGLNAMDIKKLKDVLMPFFNKVEISQHHFLDPGPGGKFRYIISNLTT
jgi:phenylacetate-CoA ligase